MAISTFYHGKFFFFFASWKHTFKDYFLNLGYITDEAGITTESYLILLHQL